MLVKLIYESYNRNVRTAFQILANQTSGLELIIKCNPYCNWYNPNLAQHIAQQWMSKICNWGIGIISVQRILNPSQLPHHKNIFLTWFQRSVTTNISTCQSTPHISAFQCRLVLCEVPRVLQRGGCYITPSLIIAFSERLDEGQSTVGNYCNCACLPLPCFSPTLWLKDNGTLMCSRWVRMEPNQKSSQVGDEGNHWPLQWAVGGLVWR